MCTGSDRDALNPLRAAFYLTIHEIYGKMDYFRRKMILRDNKVYIVLGLSGL